VIAFSATQKEKNLYLHEINFWLNKSSDLQITDQDRTRVIHSGDRSYFGEIVNFARARGGFLTGQDQLTQRIDFTQHCLSAFTQKFVDIDNGELGR